MTSLLTSACSLLRISLAMVGVFGCGGASDSPPTAAGEIAGSSLVRTVQSSPLAHEAVPKPRGGTDLIGEPARSFAPGLDWLNSPPLDLEALAGQVVLVRFWTDACPFCQASAPGLAQLRDEFEGRGLVVIGVFHPKPRGSTQGRDAVAARAKELGMTFPIALDARWETLDRWWLAGGRREATSVSFLLDRRGTIRWVHPGPEFHPGGPDDHEQCRHDFEDARRAIALLLDEPGPTASDRP